MIPQHVYVLAVVMVGWVFFRADTLSGAVGFLTAMAGLGPALPTPVAVSWHLTPELVCALAAGIAGSAPIVPLAARWRDRAAAARVWNLDAAAIAALSLILFASILQIAARSYSPFIYFRF